MSRERDLLNRTEHAVGGLWERTSPHAPLSFDGSRLTKEERYFLYKMPH